ncbi:MAG: hypothetical protein O2868_11410 [Proteobacteria bacterium]|nr:hypothetical protein [Pseudomonadota bacterium]
MSPWLIIAVSVPCVLAALIGWRVLDLRRDARAWSSLLDSSRADETRVYSSDLVRHLPPSARRYFEFTIAPGTPLRTASVIEMTGELALGTKQSPRYQSMSAGQVLAMPYGLVWKLKAGMLSGSDGFTAALSWTRFWMIHLIPVVRVGANQDHRVSAFGRVVAEGVFWVPAGLLPGPGVRWEEVDANTARATVTLGDLQQSVDVTVASDGRPTQVVIQRWSNVNPEKVFRWQPFGGRLAEFKRFSGYHLPTRVEGGNHFGTDHYFPFYKVQVTSITFPQ